MQKGSSMSNVVSWWYLTGRGWFANPPSWFHTRKEWLYSEKCWSKRLVLTWDLHADPQLSWCCVSEADWHHRLHAWRDLFWTGTEREECYWFSFSGHKDPSSAQSYRWGPTGFAGPSRCCPLEPESMLKSQPKSHPNLWDATRNWR